MNKLTRLKIKNFLLTSSLIVVFFYLILNLIVGNNHYEKIIDYFPEQNRDKINKIFFPLKTITNLQNRNIRLNEQVVYLNRKIDFTLPYGRDILLKKKLSDLNYRIFNSEVSIKGKKIKIEKFQNSDPFLRGIYKTLPGSAYIDIYKNQLFIISTIGIIGYSELSSDKIINFKQIKNNFDDYLGIDQFRRNKTYSVRDLKINQNKIFISYNEEVRKNCWTTSVLWAELNYKEINFEKLFSPSQCVEVNNIDGEFNASQSGGRITFLDTDNFILSIGDYRLRSEAQKITSLFGKIINFNIKTKKYKLISMGHRNPQGLSFDMKKNIIISTEHGPRGGDEINIIKLNQNKILNYGWPLASYGEHYPLREAHGDDADENKIIEKYKKYPLYKSHKDNGFIEPVKYFDPSIGISDIIQIDNNSYFFTSLRDRSLYFMELDKNDKIKDKIIRFEIGERIRDITKKNNEYYMFLEDTGSIAKLKFDN
tara:strand:+ start:1100 stop:2542 length:1443 start_codon:yes stop_codon:yes gene_type:complete